MFQNKNTDIILCFLPSPWYFNKTK